MMHDLLLSACNERKIVLIYTNFAETDKFSAGIVSRVFDDEIIVNHYLPNGGYDGYIAKRISDVFKVEMHTKYAGKIETLAKINETRHDEVCGTGENGFITLLEFAREKKKIVTVVLLDSDNNDAIGFVQKLEDGFCTITEVDEYGKNDGVAVFRIEDITHIACDSDDEIILWHLHGM